MPTICAPNFGDAGEVQLLPAFDGRSLWNATGSLFRIEGNMPLVIVAEGPKLSQEVLEALCSWEGPLCFLGRTNPPPKSQRLPLDDSVYVLWREHGGFLLLPTPTPALSWLAAQASLLGVPTIAAPSFWLDEILGCEGYIIAGGSESPSCEQWRGAIERAVDVGGGVAGVARRHVEARFSSEVAANKLLELYLDSTGGER
jgi:glycosyltransferase involved in cell wall biosynthesis